MKILGISAFYHDSAAALLDNGAIVAAAQEERFTRKKHDSRFPVNAIHYCMSEGNVSIEELSAIVFYDKPLLKFQRLIETYLSYAPAGVLSYLAAMPAWISDKLFLKEKIKAELIRSTNIPREKLPPLLFAEHHQSHAASAFFPSPFEEAAVLCLDGVGEKATTTLWIGKGHQLTPVWEINFPHSLGLLYSSFTYFTGFRVNSGEYKLMGLAPYGEPLYVKQILENLIDLKDDGTFHLNMDFFNYATGFKMTNEKFDELFGGPRRKPESPITQREMDIARSIQVVTEEVVLKLAKSIRKETNMKNLCLAGGVALNCVANGRLLREKIFDGLWIQPAAGDAGGSLGAAYTAYYQYFGKERHVDSNDSMKGSYLGPSVSNESVEVTLSSLGANYEILSDEELSSRVAKILANGNVVGWFQGRMEFGPRALGNRSIIGDPRNPVMQSIMNLKIKYRESFRPFAPAVLAHRATEWFDIDSESPYMLLVAPVNVKKRIQMTKEEDELFGINKLNLPRSKIPAVTHVDYSARVQSVHITTNRRFYDLIDAFDKETGCPVLINTSFNVRGEPIVCTVEDAYRCFMRTEMDYLCVENFLMVKVKQPTHQNDQTWIEEFQLD